MKPLQAVGMGLVIVALGAKVAGFDLLADPLGWLLVLYGVRRLPQLPWSSTVTALCTLALAASVVLWFPAVPEALADQDASLEWAASLPQIVAVATLCAALARLAQEAGDRRAYAWLRTALTLLVLTAVVPVVVLSVEPGAVAGMLLLGLVTIVVVIVLVFAYSSRPWAAPPTDRRLDQTTPS
ncbi:MAG: hypothetical protein H6529_12425 [Nocardioides sp.]|nr:hypothetical protein [Nocardioidaceae bacterium]MCB8957271.1 hypothetical protein [Nocardioides sp.]